MIKSVYPHFRDISAFLASFVLPFLLVSLDIDNGLGWILCLLLTPLVVSVLACRWKVVFSLTANTFLILFSFASDETFRSLRWAYFHRVLTGREQSQFLGYLFTYVIGQCMALIIAAFIQGQRIKRQSVSENDVIKRNT